ncbi:MAG: hypothetical protein HY738_09655 [Bacteroidia bacterium]|nr:hypothetical protein [Bacteroidia bacterium]
MKNQLYIYIILSAIFISFNSFCQTTDTILTQSDDSTSVTLSKPNVYIECEFCDMGYFKKEISFINYVRDSKEADIYIIITYQNTGSGGGEYSIFLVGQNQFAYKNDLQKYISRSDETEAQIREGITQILRLSLMTYIAKTPLARNIKVSYSEPAKTSSPVDKWKSWVFDINIGGWFSGEESYKQTQIWSGISASKVTANWKIETNINFNYNESRYYIEESTITGITKSQYFNIQIVKSMGEHWSSGGYINLYSSTYSNIRYCALVSPALEYNLFKYSESTRRQLRFLYYIGGSYYSYIDTTIFDKTENFLYGQKLNIAFEMIEQWGSASTSLVGSAYFHDLSKNRLNLNSSLRIRIFKGFYFDISGGISFIHDQLSLPKYGATNEQILLRQKQLATNYSYWASAGITYTFGSIYSNVVNPRFGN